MSMQKLDINMNFYITRGNTEHLVCKIETKCGYPL